MHRVRRRNRPLVIALYLNAALLAVLVALLLSRGGVGSGMALAGPVVPPIAGGNGVYLMPAQFSVNTWGCYIMDTDAQTVCAYEYFPRGEGLKLVAARNFQFDRQLKRYNTSPNPDEVKRLIELENNPLRGRDIFPPPAVQKGPETKPDDPDAKPGPGPLIVPDPKLLTPDQGAPATRPQDPPIVTPDPKLLGPEPKPGS
jgi:hypothetical protein